MLFSSQVLAKLRLDIKYKAVVFILSAFLRVVKYVFQLLFDALMIFSGVRMIIHIFLNILLG